MRHLGLSNYTVEGLKRVLKFAKVKPAVLQCKYDIYHLGYQLAAHTGIEDDLIDQLLLPILDILEIDNILV